jgi:penicillin-binding protein 1A
VNALKTIARVLGRLAKRVAMSLLVFIVLSGIAAAYGYYWFNENVLSALPTDLSAFRNYRPPTSCRVYAANGVEIDTFYLERRVWVPLVELPEIVPGAFIAAEDRRFMEHRGVDLLGIVRAVLANLRSGRPQQGGSTITQQLVKNLIVGKERSYIRKLREAVLAFRLEKEMTKTEILELYLNYVALGNGNYGVEAAAQDYFGISARKLNPGQAALLAGLVPAPSRYSPRASLERATKRRDLALRSMIEVGLLSEDEAKKYDKEPVLVPRDVTRDRQLGAAYATEVRRELRRTIGTEIAATEGLAVQTPIDLAIQQVAENAVREAVEALEERQGKMGAVRFVPPDRRAQFIARAPGLDRTRRGELIRPRKGDCFEVLVGEARDLGALVAGNWTYSLIDKERDLRVRGREEGETAKPLRASVQDGDVLRVCLDEDGDKVRLDARPWSEGAAVVVENTTGRVIALVGGYDVSIEGFIRATQAHRQPGSSFKPYVYAAALLAGRTQIDRMADTPLAMPAGGGKLWSPKNYDGKYRGIVTLRQAMTQSLNTVAVRLTLQTGIDDVIRTARSMGVRGPIRADPTIALGSSEVTLMDHVVGYTTIARLGVRTDPLFIDRVLDGRGQVIGHSGRDIVMHGQRFGKLPGGNERRVLPAGVSYELIDMMRSVVLKGTARAAAKPGFDRAGKTGTTNGFVDAWFVGFTPRYTVGVWIGTDGTATLGDKETGGRAALPAWIKIVEALPHVEGERFPVPDDAVLVRQGTEWIGLPRGSLPEEVLALDIGGAEPLPAFEDAPTGRARTSTAGEAVRTASVAAAIR